MVDCIPIDCIILIKSTSNDFCVSSGYALMTDLEKRGRNRMSDVVICSCGQAYPSIFACVALKCSDCGAFLPHLNDTVPDTLLDICLLSAFKAS